MKKSLYQEIDDFLVEHLNGIASNGHYPTPARKQAARYAIRNALGQIRAIKEERKFKKEIA